MAGKSRKQRIKRMERFLETTGAEYGKVPTTRSSRPTRDAIDSSPGFFGSARDIIKTRVGTARNRLKGWQKRQAHRGAERMRRMKEFREGK